MSAIKEYKINVPQEKLDRLKRKIDDYEWPSELEGAGWDYGSPMYVASLSEHLVPSCQLSHFRADVKKLVEYWRTKFDWRAHEKHMNTLPQYETQVEVDGFGKIDMHFLHAKSKVSGAIPMVRRFVVMVSSTAQIDIVEPPVICSWMAWIVS